MNEGLKVLIENKCTNIFSISWSDASKQGWLILVLKQNDKKSKGKLGSDDMQNNCDCRTRPSSN